MSDETKKDHDVDWAKALDDWDDSEFSPEVARDSESDQPARLQGTPPPSPFYRAPEPKHPELHDAAPTRFSHVPVTDLLYDDEATKVGEPPIDARDRPAQQPPPPSTAGKPAALRQKPRHPGPILADSDEVTTQYDGPLPASPKIAGPARVDEPPPDTHRFDKEAHERQAPSDDDDSMRETLSDGELAVDDEEWRETADALPSVTPSSAQSADESLLDTNEVWPAAKEPSRGTQVPFDPLADLRDANGNLVPYRPDSAPPTGRASVPPARPGGSAPPTQLPSAPPTELPSAPPTELPSAPPRTKGPSAIPPTRMAEGGRPGIVPRVGEDDERPTGVPPRRVSSRAESVASSTPGPDGARPRPPAPVRPSDSSATMRVANKVSAELPPIPRPSAPPPPRPSSPAPRGRSASSQAPSNVPGTERSADAANRQPSAPPGPTGAAITSPPPPPVPPPPPPPPPPAPEENLGATKSAPPAAGYPRRDQASAPPLHHPAPRIHDPDDETIPLDASSAPPPMAVAGSAPPPPPPPEASAPPPPMAQDGAHELRAPLSSRQWADERPACVGLDEATRERLLASVTWLEDELNPTTAASSRARTFLGLAELRAILGEFDEARAHVQAARSADPSCVLAHATLRALGTSSETAPFEQAADGIATADAPPEVIAHANWTAADALRLAGIEDRAARRRDLARKHAPDDIRAAAIRAALRLREAPSDEAPTEHKHETLDAALAVARAILGQTSPAAGTPAGAPSRVRRALARGDFAEAYRALLPLGSTPALAASARWLAACIGLRDLATRRDALDLLACFDQPRARRLLAARALEAQDLARLAVTIDGDGFSETDRRMLRTLASPHDASRVWLRDRTDPSEATPLDAAQAGLAGPFERGAAPEQVQERARRRASITVGSSHSRAYVSIGRLIGAGQALADALLAEQADAGDASALAAVAATRSDSNAKLASSALARLAAQLAPVDDAAGELLLAAGFAAERAGDREGASSIYGRVLDDDPGNDAAARAMGELNPEFDVATALERAADATSGSRAALLRIEADARREAARGKTEASIATLEVAHADAPELPLALEIALRRARASGDEDSVLNVLRARRASAGDAADTAFDAVREALIIADSAPEKAGALLEEVRGAFPLDYAVVELIDRVTPLSAADRLAATIEQAEAAEPGAAVALWLEAAVQCVSDANASAGDHARRAVELAEELDRGDIAAIARIVAEMHDLTSGGVGVLASEWSDRARDASDPSSEIEWLERLAEIETYIRKDSGAAILLHRAILDLDPESRGSLRALEHALISENRTGELEPIATLIARALSGTASPEFFAHAALSARLRARDGRWHDTEEMAFLVDAQPQAPAWGLRLVQAHARANRDAERELETSLALAERTSRGPEVSALLTSAGSSAMRLGRHDLARDVLRRALERDPADVLTLDLAATTDRALGESKGAAQLLERVAKHATVEPHRVRALTLAGEAWHALPDHREEAIRDYAAAFERDPTSDTCFSALAGLYAAAGQREPLLAIFERKASITEDPKARATLDIRRAELLAELGDVTRAIELLEQAVAARPADVDALSTLGALAMNAEDWDRAERAWVELARMPSSPAEQRRAYMALGELYVRAGSSLERAELAYREVLKRFADDTEATQRLVDVYQRMGDASRAAETQMGLVERAESAAIRRQRLVELALIYERTAAEPRKAEQILETARREGPADGFVLHALAHFYQRHGQDRALTVLLDRAANDAHRQFAAGRITAELVEIVGAVHELRGQHVAADACRATRAALLSEGSAWNGAGATAGDRRFDPWLAPDPMSPSAQALLLYAGDVLDALAPYDLASIEATPIEEDSPAGVVAREFAATLGVPNLSVLVSSMLGHVAVAASSTPPIIVLGSALVDAANVRGRTFMLMRAIKLVQAHACALARVPQPELGFLIAGWLHAFHSSWLPPGLDRGRVVDIGGRIRQALGDRVTVELGTQALEVVGSIGQDPTSLAGAARAWANRSALLAVGDLNAALDALAWSTGLADGAPRGEGERTAWIARVAEARDLVVFSLTEAYARAREAAGLAHTPE